MGRKVEKGIKYYQMKVDHTANKKIRLLFNEFDSHGYWIWSCLVDKIYKDEGYYFDTTDEDALELFATDVCKKQVSLVKEVIARCVKRSLFDERVFDLFGILTSDRIQLHYLEATAERRRKGTELEFIREFLVIDHQENGKDWQNVRMIERKSDSSRELSNKSREQSGISADVSAKDKRRKEKSSDPNGSPGFQPGRAPQFDSKKDLKSAYKQVVKTEKRAVFDFLKKRPAFIEPYVDFWNLFAQEHSLAQVKTISDTRWRKFAVRIREQAFNFPEILRKAKGSEFCLTGKWFAFDWLLENSSNYLKVLEGNYEQKTSEKHNEPADATAERMEKLYAGKGEA